MKMNPNAESSSNKVDNELEVSDDEVLTPKSALISLQQQSKMKEQASKWMIVMKSDKHAGVSCRLSWSDDVEEGMKKAMAAGVLYFDKKPVIFHQWDLEENYSHKDVTSVPVWIKLHGLDFKKWSENVLEKLLQSIGTFCKVEQSTKDRKKLLYVRVMVEMKLDKVWELHLHFINEKGITITQAIEY
ncbi:30S ribosomal protein S8 [Bienertia sinuspersici]